jgi:hypothetical protein
LRIKEQETRLILYEHDDDDDDDDDDFLHLLLDSVEVQSHPFAQIAVVC